VLEAKVRILKSISAKQEIHGYALAKELGLNVATVYEHLGDLEGGGYVQASRRGRRKLYRLTPRGKDLLKAVAD